MAHATKELEERIQELGKKLSSPPDAAEELLPLLDQADGFLSRVEQSPSDSMLAVLQPLMDALVTDELLRHSDMDVKVSVASCISEITRITAPDAPYNDDLMKDIFKMIVESFERLDDTSSPSFRRRVSILETVAKVRSCVVMLDLECDALILEMFRHFLKTIRSNHPENVFSSMETIMSLVIEESEDVSSELISLLLSHVKNDNEDVTPIACNLVEKVMGSCAAKLKPLLAEVVQSTGAVSEYSKIVASICQENSDALEQNINASGETLADDSKLSERTVSDELPQLDQEVGCQEKVGNARDNSPMAVMSNGTIQLGNGDSTGEQPSPKSKSERSRRSDQSKNIVAADSDNLEPVAGKPDGISDPNSKKVRGRKTTTSVQLTDTTDHSQNDSDKEASAATSRRKGFSKEADTSQVDTQSGKELETVDNSGLEKKNDLQLPQGSDNMVPSVASPTPIGSSQDATGRKRGRPSRKNAVNAAADEHASASGVKGSLRRSQLQDEVLTAKNVDDEKELQGDESEGKPRRRSGKKAHSENADDGEETKTVTSDAEGKAERNTAKTPKGKASGGESSGRKPKSSAKQQMKEVIHSKDVPGEPTLKEMVLSPTDAKKAPSKTQSEDGAKTKSGRKRARVTEKIAETSEQKKGEPDGNLVGAKVQVWWPDDEKFYEGTVKSFDRKSKKHEVYYDDGDVEHLLLKNERWELLEQAKDITNTDDLQMSQRKKAKQTSLSTPKHGRTESPLKSGTESGDRTDEVIKRKGRPRKVVNDDTPTSNRNLRAKAASEGEGVSPKTSAKLNDDLGSKSRETPRDGGRIKDETPNTSGKAKDATPRSGKEEASKPRRKSKFSSPEANSMPKHDAPKIISNSKEDAISSDDTPKTVSKKDEVASGGKSVRGTSNSGRGRRGSATPRSRSSGGSTADGSSDKGKSKIQEGENTSGGKESSGKARTKRKRRGSRS